MHISPKARVLWLAAPLSVALAAAGIFAVDVDAAGPAASAAPAAAIPLAGLTPSTEVLVGRVEERLPAGGYVYLAIRGDDGVQRWAVVMGAAPLVGAAVRARSMGKRVDFRSARLQRSFSELHFASLKAPRST